MLRRRITRPAERIDELVGRYAKYGYLNGAVLVAEQGKIIYEKGIGEANMELHVPNTPRTKFGIASLTKQFTAVLVLQQVAKGGIRLEGKVSDYLPWYRQDTGERMTIEQVLHHTAGLPSDFDMPGNYFSWILRYPEQDDVIIVLRNVYGSTERLEQNIQAILYDMEPKMPSRSAKDLAAQAWLGPEAWAESHRMLSALVGLFAVAVIRQAARRRRRTGIPNQA